MKSKNKIYVAGHRGLVGSAICRALTAQGFNNILTRTHAELDLTSQQEVRDFFRVEKPEYVFLAAAKVGGINANNSYPADFIRDNLSIQSNVIDSAYQEKSKKLLFLGSSCIYPKMAHQPMKEECLLSGPLEPTNEWYAVAKIAGIKMCQAYRRQYDFDAISLMPTNLYGSGDNFDLENAHVLPALIRKFHEAKFSDLEKVEVWGTGAPKREFLHVDDLASACLLLMERYNSEDIINVGSGQEVTIAELASLVKDVVGFNGKIVFNTEMPDGTPRKLLDNSRLENLGFTPRLSLQEGVRNTYNWYLDNISSLRK
ncbi:MAG: GDP-L-fucose synthase [Bacteroidetes bacterium]|nr:GDP-L-fucose synthase [Bacteroidota bacterium]